MVVGSGNAREISETTLKMFLKWNSTEPKDPWKAESQGAEPFSMYNANSGQNGKRDIRKNKETTGKFM